MKAIYSAIAIVLSWILVSSAIAQELFVSASVNTDTVPVGGNLTLTIRIQGIQSIPAPTLPQISGFRSQYLGISNQVSIINGRTSASVDYSYNLRAIQMGQFTIPSISIKHGNKAYRTDPIKIQVGAGSGSAPRKAITSDDLQKYISLEILADKKTAYINEGIPLAIRLYVRSGVQVQEISRRPELPSAGFSVLPMGSPSQRATTINGVRFAVVDFSTTVYPVKSGELTLGPAEMDCRVVIRSSQSRRGTRANLNIKSEPYTITVNPLPTAGQPTDFSGVVGRYSLNVEAKPTSLKVGEPITLTMIIQGTGNIDAVDIPIITDLTQFKLYDPQINVKKNANTGMKTFEQVLIPESADIEAIPEIQFSYFDPDVGQYKTETEGPIPLQIVPSDEEGLLQILEISKGKAVRREVLGRDIIYIKDEIGNVASGDVRLYKNKGFLFLQLIPLAGFAGILVYQKRHDRFATDRTYARQYHAPRKAKKGFTQAQELIASDQPQEFCSTIFKTVQEYLGDRFNLSSAGITVEVVGSLRSQGLAEETLEKLTDFFQACDRLRFTQCEMDKHEMGDMLGLAEEIVSLLENNKAAVA
ncbi:BatD family protein [Candidatus Poribacteria bacterium]